jgi:hypothetical protein
MSAPAKGQHFDRKIDAQARLDSIDTAVQTGTQIDSAQGRVDLGTWSRRWLTGQVHLTPSTSERYAGLVRKHVEPHWGNDRLEYVSHADGQAWVSGLTVDYSPSTARMAHRVLSLMLALAVRDGRLARNPAADVRRPYEVQCDRRYLDHAHVRELAHACATLAEAVAG